MSAASVYILVGRVAHSLAATAVLVLDAATAALVLSAAMTALVLRAATATFVPTAATAALVLPASSPLVMRALRGLVAVGDAVVARRRRCWFCALVRGRGSRLARGRGGGGLPAFQLALMQTVLVKIGRVRSGGTSSLGVH